MTSKLKPKALRKSGPPEPNDPAYYKDDSISVDTSQAPWMDVAWQECDKKIKENEDYESFASLWYTSIVQHESEHHFLSEDLKADSVVPAITDKSDSPFMKPGLKEHHTLLKAVLDAERGPSLRTRIPKSRSTSPDSKLIPTATPKDGLGESLL